MHPSRRMDPLRLATLHHPAGSACSGSAAGNCQANCLSLVPVRGNNFVPEKIVMPDVEAQFNHTGLDLFPVDVPGPVGHKGSPETRTIAHTIYLGLGKRAGVDNQNGLDVALYHGKERRLDRSSPERKLKACLLFVGRIRLPISLSNISCFLLNRPASHFRGSLPLSEGT